MVVTAVEDHTLEFIAVALEFGSSSHRSRLAEVSATLRSVARGLIAVVVVPAIVVTSVVGTGRSGSSGRTRHAGAQTIGDSPAKR